VLGFTPTLGQSGVATFLDSLMDSIVSPKVQITEGEGKGVGAHSLACNTFGVEGVLELRDGDYEG